MRYITPIEVQSLFTKTEEQEYRICDFLNTFRQLGIKEGDTVCVHS